MTELHLKMHLLEKLCCLCADDMDLSISLESFGDLIEIHKLINFSFNSSSCICTKCFALLNRIQRFSERCNKAQQFLQYLTNLSEPSQQDLEDARKQFGLENDNKADRATDTIDLQLDIKDEFIDSHSQVEALNCEDHSFDELEDFGEISTIALPDNSFVETEVGNTVIEEVEEEEEEEAKFEVIEQSCDEILDETDDKKDEDDADLDFSCQNCSESFKNFISLQSHCKKEHETGAQIVCSCGSLLTSRVQIQLHKKLHKSEKVYECKHCEKIYSHQQSLHNHMKKLHPESDKTPFLCVQCPKRFESEKKLKVHEQVHLPDDKKMIHPCPYCDKKFTKSVNVQAHIRSIHQMERPFLCSDCGKNFSTKGALKEHQIIHSDTYPHQCSYCPKKFKNLPRLKTHEDIHNNTQYICNICGISLNTKRTLKMHMVVHSDQKKYKCQYCGSSFKRSKALKNHLILHSGLRPYSCPFCDKTFANGSNCRSHKKKAHPNELAALEASGRSSNAAPNIPRLEQLQPKNQQVQHLITVDGSNMILQQMPLTSADVKQELPSLQILNQPSSDSFQVRQIQQTTQTQ